MLDVHALIFQILTYVIQLVIVILVGAVCDFIIKKAGQSRFAAYANNARMAVQAAEQMLGPSLGADKKLLVVDWITNAIGKKLPADEIEKLIESAVFEMNLVIKSKVQPNSTPAATEEVVSPVEVAPVPVEPVPAVETAQPETPTVG